MTDELTLTVNGNIIAGWEKIRVTRGMERCPNDFDILMTEHYPVGDLADVVVLPGDPCQVKIGSDLVITGYIDKYIPGIDKQSHTVRITGRGKCQDLVDCAAEWPNGQVTGASALQVAQKLAQPYGITVTADPGAFEDPLVLKPIPQLNLILTETAWEIIERTCRYRGLLSYENPDGNLYLSRVGTTSMASGFAQGQNVESATFEMSMDQRFQKYNVYLQSVQAYRDVGAGANCIETVVDSNVKRNRQMSIIAEGDGTLGINVAQARGYWEKNRREGRSTKVTLTTDSWRDSDGTLWTPNRLTTISLPSLKVQPDPATWIISEVTYHLDEKGTTAELTMMPPAAFTPAPILLLAPLAELSGGQP